jgi:hypothetical protein
MQSVTGSTSPNVIDLTDSSPMSVASIKKTTNLNVRKGFQPQRGPRRIVIKNLKTTPKYGPEAYFTETWQQLSSALDSVFAQGAPPLSQEELYRGVENICRNGQAKELFEHLRQKLDDNVSQVLKPRILDFPSGNNVELLRLVEDQWGRWDEQLKIVIMIFYYLDRSYLLNSSSPSISNLGIDLFKQHIVLNPGLQPLIFSGMFTLFRADRSGGKKNDELLKHSMCMIYELNIYTTLFEPRFMEDTQQYYSEIATRSSTELGLGEWVEEASKIIEDEQRRCEELKISSTSVRALNVVLNDELIRTHAKTHIKGNEFRDMTAAKDVGLLTKLYSLLARVDLTGLLRPEWGEVIKAEGRKIVADEKTEQMTERLLIFKKTLDQILRDAFCEDQGLSDTLRESFKTFINEAGPRLPGTRSVSLNAKVAEMISKYLDQLLRSGRKAIPTPLVDENIADDDAQLFYQLDTALDLFRFIQGKDVFEAFYKKDLARRLLLKRSASAEAEKLMLSKLRDECGSSFTHNLDSMFKDMDVAKDQMETYRAKVGEKHGMDLTVDVLSAAAWPTYPDAKVLLPDEISKQLQNYEDFYRQANKGRKLSFKHTLSHSTLIARFPTGVKELVVSAYQAVVLLLFNGSDPNEHLTYLQITQETELSKSLGNVQRTDSSS